MSTIVMTKDETEEILIADKELQYTLYIRDDDGYKLKDLGVAPNSNTVDNFIAVWETLGFDVLDV